MKFTLKALLAVVLFCSVTFADEPGNPEPSPTPTPTGSGRTGDMGSGGRPSGAPVETGTATTSLDSVIVSVIRQYLGLSF